MAEAKSNQESGFGGHRDIFNARRLMASRDKIWSLQYLRGLAALAVVIWHTGWSRTVIGQSGVDLFFVISGFVMMLVSGRENSAVRFGTARVARIIPLYWGVTLLTALYDHPTFAKLVTSLLFWPNGIFPVVIQGWSLNLEAVYYILFAFTFFVPALWRLPMLTAQIFILCFIAPLMLKSEIVSESVQDHVQF